MTSPKRLQFGGVTRSWETVATESKRFVVRPSGFEPPTFCSGGKRSIQLSYGRTMKTNGLSAWTLTLSPISSKPFGVQRSSWRSVLWAVCRR